MASGSGKGSGGLAHVSEFVDNAVNHVEGAFSTLNNIFSEATGQVFHKLSGGKIDKYEVNSNGILCIWAFTQLKCSGVAHRRLDLPI